MTYDTKSNRTMTRSIKIGTGAFPTMLTHENTEISNVLFRVFS